MHSTVTVLERATSLNLTTPERAKAFLPTGANDTKVTMAIEQASAAINRHCGYTLRAEKVRQVFTFGHNDHDGTLVLDRKPIVHIESITEGDDAELGEDDYELDKLNGMIRRVHSTRVPRRFWAHPQVTVIYTAGYSAETLASESSESEASIGAPIDPTLERACILLVQTYYSTGARDPNVRSVEIPGVITKQYGDPPSGAGEGLPEEVCALLKPWTKVLRV
jgi:hypothetical protein